MTTLSDALTAGLFHSLWQDVLVAAVLLAALTALRERSPNSRYLAACAALAVMTAAPLFTAAWAFQQALPVPMTQLAARDRALVAASAPVAFGGGGEGAQAGATDLSAVRRWTLPIWIAGVLTFSIRLLLAGGHARSVRLHGAPADEQLNSLVRQLGLRIGVARRITLLIAPLADGPATLGWLRPVILLPPATAMAITPEQLAGLLTHELAHIKRHDYLVNLAQMVIETLFFYHPAVWWASRRIRLERELCCDDEAVRACGNPADYAAALARVARAQVTGPAAVVAAARGPLAERVERLLRSPSTDPALARWPALVMLITALATASLGAAWLGPLQAGTAGGTGVIWGYAYDPLGQPAANVMVTLDNNVTDPQRPTAGRAMLIETRTDAFGAYRFENVPPGAYVLTPAVGWARATTVYSPPSGSVQHDIWIAFERVTTAVYFVNRPLPPAAAVTEVPTSEPSGQSLIGPRYLRGIGMRPYPDDLRLSGDVVLEGYIAADGTAKELRVISAPEPDLARAALAAVRQERWEPARIRGVPLEVPLRINVIYRLGNN